VSRLLSAGTVLRQFVRVGVGLERDPDDGGPVLVLPEDVELTAVAHFYALWYRWLFVWALSGADTGHRWHICDCCDEIVMRHATAANRGRGCSMTFGCPGHTYTAELVVPARRRTHKVRIEPDPAGIWKLPKAPKRSKAGSRRGPNRPARDGDKVVLLACPVHNVTRWVKSTYATEWRCAARIDEDDECGLPGQSFQTATLRPMAGALVPVPGGES
jgi:hypothetical protein